MNDAEYKKQMARIKKYRDFWRDHLGCNDWRIKWDFYREPFTESNVGPGMAVAGDCNAKWMYKQASIRIDCSAIADIPDDELEEMVVHEMLHASVNEMREQKDWLNHEERVVTQLARAFLRLRDELTTPKTRTKHV